MRTIMIVSQKVFCDEGSTYHPTQDLVMNWRYPEATTAIEAIDAWKAEHPSIHVFRVLPDLDQVESDRHGWAAYFGEYLAGELHAHPGAG